MILDSQAIEHLELLKSNMGAKSISATLFDYIDHCSTSFGRRMLKKWMLSPLTEIDMLEERYDSVEDLILHPQESKNL